MLVKTVFMLRKKTFGDAAAGSMVIDLVLVCQNRFCQVLFEQFGFIIFILLSLNETLMTHQYDSGLTKPIKGIPSST